MIFHENRLLADDSHEISFLICIFWKSGKIWNCHLLQIIGGAWRINLWYRTVLKDLTCLLLYPSYLCLILYSTAAMINKVRKQLKYKWRMLPLCLLGNSACFFVVCWFFSKSTFPKEIFQECNQSVKQFWFRSGRMLCRAWSGSKLFTKVISRQHQLAKS